jgi:putative membrane protein
MRLHPLSVVGKVYLAFAVLFTTFLLGVLTPLIVLGYPLDFLFEMSLLAILLLIWFVLSVGYGIAYHFLFEYELVEDTFNVISGVFYRKHREIPLYRIQNINITQSFIQRLLGLAVVQFETAGGNQTEAELDFVSKKEAARLQSNIRERKQATSETDKQPTTEPKEEQQNTTSALLFNLQSIELALLSVTFIRPGAVVLLLGGLPFGQDIAISILLSLAQPLGGPTEFSFETFTPDEVLALVIVGLPLAALGAWAISAVYTGVAYFGFELGRIGDNLVYERGLLQRYSGSIPLGKVQSLTITEPVLARPLNYAGLKVETAGYAAEQSQSHGSVATVPLARRERTVELARTIEPFGNITFDRPPKRARRRYAGRYLTIIVTLIAGSYLVSMMYGKFTHWYAPGVLIPLIPMAAHYKWKHRGYHTGENHIALRTGFWQRTTQIVPYSRLQTVMTSQTISQRRLGIASLTADIASPSTFLGADATACDIEHDTARHLHSRLRKRLQRGLEMEHD